MRNYDTPVRAIRHKVYVEVAKAGFESTDETLIHDIEAIPYNIVEEKAKYRESIYRERAVASERVRLAMGLSLRPENKAVHLTDGLAASNIDEKYYEPPLMQVIPSACAACPPNKYIVSNMCRGCVAHPEQACGVKAIGSDEQGRASILEDKCVSCGMCMVSCPFGAISDKSQIFQLAHALRGGEKIIAIVYPLLKQTLRLPWYLPHQCRAFSESAPENAVKLPGRMDHRAALPGSESGKEPVLCLLPPFLFHHPED